MISKTEFDLAKFSPARMREVTAKATSEYFAEGGLVTRKELDGSVTYLDARGNPVVVAPD